MKKNFVVSSWIRGPDPQRDGLVESRTPEEMSAELRASVHGSEYVILESEIDETNVYLDRWKVQYDWLRNASDADLVWFVDIGDVKMLRQPWPFMDRRMIYVGYADGSLLNHPWVLHNHPAPFLQDFVRSTDRQLLNPGVIGGSRGVMIDFHVEMLDLIEEHGSDLGWDVGPANWIVYNLFKDRFVTGPQVVNEFKSYKDNGQAWWMHK